MKRTLCWVLAAFCIVLTAPRAWGTESTLQFGGFGTINLYQTSPQPPHVALFITGDGGWDAGGIELARQLATLDTLIIGVEVNRFLQQIAETKGACAYPAGDLESLSKYVQMKLGYPHYVTPVLIGYSSGATLAYAILAQAPGNTFLGAMSLGFCSDLEMAKPLCRGAGLEWTPLPKGNGFDFLPAKHLQVPWVTFQGTEDQVCEAGKSKLFADQVPRGQAVILPKVGHGFAVAKNWLPQFREKFESITSPNRDKSASTSTDLADLPLVEIPSTAPGSDRMAVFLSGDGGWADLDKNVSGKLAEAGIPVVGVNSLKYFWTARTPEGTAADLARVILHYGQLWKKTRVLLIGYSMGADVAPFAANNLSPELKSRLDLLALLGPGLRADFQFHVGDWLGMDSKSSLPIPPEIAKLGDTRLLCVHGEEEKDSLCPGLKGGNVKTIALRGAHHFGGDYTGIARDILDALGK